MVVRYYFRYSQSNNSAPQPTVNVARILPTPSQQDWFPDIAATNHVTPNIANLQISVPHNGNGHRACARIPFRGVWSACEEHEKVRGGRVQRSSESQAGR